MGVPTREWGEAGSVVDHLGTALQSIIDAGVGARGAPETLIDGGIGGGDSEVASHGRHSFRHSPRAR